MRQIDINHVVKKSNWQITKLKKKIVFSDDESDDDQNSLFAKF